MSSGPYITQTETAQSIPFDNSTNGFIATDVQTAIEESTFNLSHLEVSSSTGITAGTGADTLMTSMTLTPAAGTWMTFFSCDITSSTAGAATSVSIYVAGTQDADSLRKVAPFDGGALSATSARCGVAINRTLVVNGSQAVEIRWSASNGTNTVASRVLSMIRVD